MPTFYGIPAQSGAAGPVVIDPSSNYAKRYTTPAVVHPTVKMNRMGKLLQWCGPRAVVAYGVLLALICASAPTTLLAGDSRSTKDFRDAVEVAERYVEQFGPEHVLLVVDVDNTLLAMNHALGSDQWFEWQQHLLETQPHSPLLVAKTFDGLLEAQGLLYNLGRMHPPQRDLPAIIGQIQDLGLFTLVLTSRGDEFRVSTKRELLRNGYDFAETAVAVRDLPGGLYQPYDPEEPHAHGLTPKEVAACEVDIPRPVSYADGMFMGAGQHKGAMLFSLLHHAVPEIRAIVFVDDHQRNIERVSEMAASRGIEITAFRYAREDAKVRAFQNGHKRDVDRRWRCLERTLNAVFD